METIEERYGTERAGDWLDIYIASPFKVAQQVVYTNPVSGAQCSGKVLSIRRRSTGLQAGIYMIQVRLYLVTQMPTKWINCKWLVKEE